MTVASAIANSGVLWANGANLTVHRDVSGNGTAIIDGGAAGTLKLEDKRGLTEQPGYRKR